MEKVIDESSAKDLVDAMIKIPNLGLYGSIAAIVLMVLMVVAWFWLKGIRNKAVQKETEAQRARDQAGTVTDNQKIEADRLAAEMRIEEMRKQEASAGKKPIPPQPS